MIELSLWDTAFWQKKIGRGPLVAEIEAREIDCLWMLLPATDIVQIQAAELGGAHFMDFRVDYVRETGPVAAISRPIKQDDVEALAAIARTAFRGLTRFYADPRLDNDRCDDLYEGWFRENVDDPDVDVLMVGDGGGPAGFVTVKMVPGDEASIILIACSEQSRGRGIGKMLAGAAVNHAHHAGIPAISVVTQGCNIPSQRAFQGAGFRLRSSSVWMHKWSS